LTGKTEDSEKNLSQCHFVHPKSTWIDPGENPGLRGERPATNDLSHGTVRVVSLLRWEDAIIVGPKEMQGEDIDCIELVQIIVQWRILVNTLMVIQILLRILKGLGNPLHRMADDIRNCPRTTDSRRYFKFTLANCPSKKTGISWPCYGSDG
jgi:hypothetical protein